MNEPMSTNSILGLILVCITVIAVNSYFIMWLLNRIAKALEVLAGLK